MKITLSTIKSHLYTKNEYGYEYQDSTAVLTPEEISWLAKNYHIRTNVHRMCINCQARQIIKYHPDPAQNGVGNPFCVQCDFVPDVLPAGKQALTRMITEQNIEPERAKLLLRSAIDPGAWCELMFGFSDDDPDWRLRSYQKEQIRCSSKMYVIREGRRAGKTFAIAARLIYAIFNKKIIQGRDSTGKQTVAGPRILVITPYQSQITNVFSEMEKLLKRNVDLEREVKSGTGGSLYIKTPFYKMEFANGAIVSGFVSGLGTKQDGSGGGVIRGQNADIIYLDEMDMIPDEVIEKVVLPLLLTTKNVMMIATSTPIGKRGRFWKWCLETKNFKEDYLPSTVLPQWESQKTSLEDENSIDSFAAEYMAAFIEGGHGVFKPVDVETARKDYVYDDTGRTNWWAQNFSVVDKDKIIKVLGIDWNKNAGSEFCVVGYDNNTGTYVVCEAINVSASESSARRWMEEVVRLNAKWKLDYIYADEGYGHTIIEDLKLLSFQVSQKPNKTYQDHQTERIKDRLVSFNFSGKVELTDPMDGSPITKASKDFLVENAIRIFETKKIWFSENDSTMRAQLKNYVILRRSPTTNKAIYGPEKESVGDHRLDALMLGLGGIQLESGVYSKGAILMSLPAAYSKEFLDRRQAQEGDVAGSSLDFTTRLQKMPAVAPMTLNILNVVRPPGYRPPEEALPRVQRRGDHDESRREGESVLAHMRRLAHSNTREDDEGRGDKSNRPLSVPIIIPRGNGGSGGGKIGRGGRR